MQPDAEARRRPVYAYRDRTVGVDLAASTYPYGGGMPGRGLQVTLIKDVSVVLSVRLPAEDAIALARAIVREFADVADGPLLTLSEVAKRWNVNPKTVQRWARNGRINSIRTLGGHRRFRLADVLAVLEDRR